jgi:hypothetical protein
MSGFIPKPNTGTLWPNDRKTSENHPDKRGDVVISASLLRTLLAKGEDPVKLTVAAWEKSINGKDCLSLAVSEPYVKPVEGVARAAAAVDPDEDVPF